MPSAVSCSDLAMLDRPKPVPACFGSQYVSALEAWSSPANPVISCCAQSPHTPVFPAFAFATRARVSNCCWPISPTERACRAFAKCRAARQRNARCVDGLAAGQEGEGWSGPRPCAAVAVQGGREKAGPCHQCRAPSGGSERGQRLRTLLSFARCKRPPRRFMKWADGLS